MSQQTRRGGKRPTQVWLFSDMLLYGEPVGTLPSGQPSFCVYPAIPIGGVFVAEEISSLNNSFNVMSESDSFTLWTEYDFVNIRPSVMSV